MAENVVDMTLRFRGDSAQLNKEADKVKKTLRGYNAEATKTVKNNNVIAGTFRNAATSASVLQGPMGGISSRLSSMASLLDNGSLAWVGFGASGSAAMALIASGLPYLADTERSLLQVESLIKATGYSTGFTAQEMDEFARSVAMATLTSTEEARKAIGVLLTFKSVTGETFKDAINLSQDMASVFGGDMKSAATSLGKALEDPTKGISALSRNGVTFSETQKEMISTMMDANDIAGAQAEILQTLKEQFGGAAASEAGGLTGQVDTFGQVWQEMLEKLADKSGAMHVAKVTMQDLIYVMNKVSDYVAPPVEKEMNDLLTRRIELTKRLKEMGHYDDLMSINPNPLGESKNTYRNVQRELGEIYLRMKEIQDEQKARIIKEGEVRDKALEAEKARTLAAEEAKAAAAEKVAEEKAQKEAKRQAKADERKQAADSKQFERDKAAAQRNVELIAQRNLDELSLLDVKYQEEDLKLFNQLNNKLLTLEEYERASTELAADHARQRTEILDERLREEEEKNQGFWERYAESMSKSATDTDELWKQTFDNFTTGFGNAFASAIMDSETAGEAFRNFAGGMARSMLAALGKIMAQRMVMWALEKTMLKGEAAGNVARATSEANTASLQSGINAYKSTAAIPYVGPAMAPAAMNLAIATTQPMVAAVSASASAGLAGVFHGGGMIPREGTYLLDGGEQVYTRTQHNKLMQNIDSSGQGSSQPWTVNIHEAPAGTSYQIDDSEKIISVVCGSMLEGGEIDQVMTTKYGMESRGFR